MDGSDSDETRGEEISLAEARRPYQITMVNHAGMLKLEGTQKSSAAQKCCRLVRILVPHFCLLLTTIGYICMVAIVYHFVEGDNEKMERVKLEMSIERAQRNLMAQIHNLAPGISIEKLHRETEEFSKEMLKLGRAQGRLGIPISAKNGNEGEPVWNWANSLLFATSLLSRIGYGHLFPVTQTGKILIAPFVIFGIPLFFIAIADLAKFFSEFVHFCYFFCQKHIQRIFQKFRMRKPSPLSNGQRNNNASIKSTRSQEKRTQEEEKSTQGVSLNLNDVMIFSEEEIGEEWQNEDKQRVPLIAVFLSLFPLLALLAAIYFHLEGWAWLDCFYFVIVTFTGIGFGDFAPGSSLSAFSTVCLIIPVFAFNTLLIDLSGTEYIRMIHCFGSKFSNIYNGFRTKLRKRKKRKRMRRN